ncbi:hypothetical protein, conserved [Eimeria tenella]|uniref:Spindle assembly abnormal protein 6 N-terminal domain-containing protein n=1 Tax=Eimeria tenella TaxID=5802 RepID=U6KWB3_EIMTE|nr:hypothetical protein, conserved [Eimeria tenella]CDJ42261.1 hypothetical protein, conserved [Eimeria tenella]|eukprot:XP_013233011.1 hypothetical protein, conserved [Eimeria tenella]
MANRASADAACAFDGMLPPADSAAFLTHFDFSAIDEMDPSLGKPLIFVNMCPDGHILLYEREVPCELRMQEGTKAPQDVGRLEPIRVKVLILGEEAHPREVRIEASSENDLFFHYTHVADEKSFRQMQQSQKLMIEFADYSQVLMKMLNSCIREPHSFLAVFVMETTGKGRLDFIQNMEYKFIELLSCDFLQSSEEVIRQQMSFRYNALKSKLALMHARLHDIGALVKVKSPSLLLHLQKSAAHQLQTKRTGVRGSSFSPKP